MTIWLDGRQQPSSVFLEPYNTPNYSVRKIKESERAAEWKKKKRAKISRRAMNSRETQNLTLLKTEETVIRGWMICEVPEGLPLSLEYKNNKQMEKYVKYVMKPQKKNLTNSLERLSFPRNIFSFLSKHG